MSKKLFLVLPLLLLPSLALAQANGGGTDRDRLNREVEAMQRDGRWQRLLAEGQANRLAFERMRQAEQAGSSQTVFSAQAPERTRRRP